jgi:hypothetical protein
VLQRFTIAIVLKGIPRDDSGRVLPAEVLRVSEALSNSITYGTFHLPTSRLLVRPIVRIRSDPRRLMVELLAEEAANEAEALAWRNAAYQHKVFSEAIKKAAALAISDWSSSSHDIARIASWDGSVRSSTADRDAAGEYVQSS